MLLNLVIQSILEGNEGELDKIYLHLKKPFIDWVKKTYTVDEELAKDAFQEAVVSFYFNVKQGKVKNTEVTLKTYLFAIGKNIVLNKLRKTKSEIKVDLYESQAYEIKENNLIETLFDEDEQQSLLKKKLSQLGQNCRTLLKLFYFDNNSMEAIANKMEYKNENVAKTQKMRCIKELKKLLKS